MKKRYSKPSRSAAMVAAWARRKARMKKPEKRIYAKHVHVIDGGMGDVRLWCSWMPGDVFTVMTKDRWANEVRPMMLMIGLINSVFYETEPKADDGEVVCEHCKGMAV